MPMDQDLKDRWVAALRGGDYKQGQSRLRIDERYCCLGVLCDVSGRGKWEVEFDNTSCREGSCYRYVVPDDPCSDDGDNVIYISGKTCRSIGLDSRKALDLAAMNDEYQSFEAIADEIVRSV